MSCVSAFCNVLQQFIGEIFGIPENVPRFLKNIFHIPDERQLGLASLPLSLDGGFRSPGVSCDIIKNLFLVKL